MLSSYPRRRKAVTIRLRRLGAAAVVVVATMASSRPADAALAPGMRQITLPHFKRAHFSHSIRIDNEFVPLLPGTQLVLKGRVSQGKASLSHRIVITVTHLTKVIDGVRTVVVWERDFDGAQLAESELAFEAQDDAGNVWNLGEFPEEFDHGRFQGAPSTWIAGLSGATPGILMLAAPRVDTPSYSEGRAPKVGFADEAKVHQTAATTCVPVRCFHNVLVIDEFSPLDPTGGHQLKSYAPGVGNIRVTPVGGEQREELVLTSISHLGEEAAEAVCQQALKLDHRAFQISADYRHTRPATPRDDTCR
jgi:hypothetical protein